MATVDQAGARQCLQHLTQARTLCSQEVRGLGESVSRAEHVEPSFRRGCLRRELPYHGWDAHQAVWSTAAATVNRQAKTVSISASSTTPHYTSNRLFNRVAQACVVAAYPSIDEHYPREAVARFVGADECVGVIRQLLVDDARRARMRTAAEDYTWRHHTWADRISQLLVKVTTLPITRNGYILRAAARLWDQRARQLGPRAVGHIRWTEEKFQAETKTWWERLSPPLLSLRHITDRTILDFGCGLDDSPCGSPSKASMSLAWTLPPRW
jgi:hypothetical protein